MHTNDLHATLLALMGLDHEKLTYRYAGRDFRLTDVAGNVVDGDLRVTIGRAKPGAPIACGFSATDCATPRSDHSPETLTIT